MDKRFQTVSNWTFSCLTLTNFDLTRIPIALTLNFDHIINKETKQKLGFKWLWVGLLFLFPLFVLIARSTTQGVPVWVPNQASPGPFGGSNRSNKWSVSVTLHQRFPCWQADNFSCRFIYTRSVRVTACIGPSVVTESSFIISHL